MFKSKATKLVTGLLGLATALAFTAPAASAQTYDASALAAQIQQLQAQLSALGGSSASCAFTFTASLAVGSTGVQVMNLQKFLNMSADTQVSVTGAGSPGNESSYFGPATKKAVMKFQAKYGIAQLGNVGPMTRAKLNSLCSTTTPPGTVPPVVITGPVSVSLALDNPASGYVIANQATADLAHFAFMGNGVVTSVKLHRSGISDQNTLSNVYLYDGATRLTDGYSFNSTGDIVINNLNIAVNGTKVIAVKADASSTAGNDSTIAVALTSFTTASGVSTVNVMGNLMNLATGTSLAGISLSNTTTPSVAQDVNAGTSAFTFWSNTLQVNTRTVWLKGANFRMIGSAPSDALSNISLFVDGVNTGRTATVTSITGSNYAMFDLSSNPLALTTGSHVIDVRANVEKGSDRNVQFSLQQAADLTVTDPQVGVNVAVTNSNLSGFTAKSAEIISIKAGSATVVIDPTFQQLTTVTGGASNVAIGRFKIHAYGEDVKVQSLSVTPSVVGASAGSSLDEVTLYYNGSQVGTQQDFTGSALTFNLGSQMIATAGVDSFLEVRANIRTSTSTNYTDGTVAVTLAAGSSNAQGQLSQKPVNFPTAQIVGNSLTIQTGLLVVAKNPGYANQNANPNTAGVKIGSFVLQNQSSSESVRVTSIGIALSGTASTTNFSGLRLSETSGSAGTPVQPQSTNTFSSDFTLAPGATKIIDVLADTSTQTSATVITTATVTYIGTTSNVAATYTATTGQTITLSSGSVSTTPTLLSSNSTVAQYIAAAGGLTDGSKASYSIMATGGVATISELKFAVTGTSTVSSIRVGSVSAPVVGGIAYLTGLNLAVPNGGSGLTLDAYASYSDVGINGITSGTTSAVALTYIKYTSGGVTTATTTNVTAPTMTMVGSKPSLSIGLPNSNGTAGSNTSVSGLSTGTKYVADIAVTANAKGDIKVTQLPVSFIGNSASTTVSTSTFNVKDGNGTVISTATLASGSTTGVGTSNMTANITFTNGLQIAAGTTQVFRIEVAVSGLAGASGGDSITTALGSAANFLWTDVAGNGVAGAGTGTLITNFPTTGVTMRTN